MLSRTRNCWCVAALATVLSSCGGTEPSQTGQNGAVSTLDGGTTEIDSSDEPRSTTAVALPIADLLRASNEFASSLADLQAVNINECMRVKGFDYQLSRAEVPAELSEVEVLARRYGAPQTRVADGVVGYAFDNAGESLLPEEPIATEAETKALIGETVLTDRLDGVGGNAVGEVTIGNGCVGNSLVEVFGSADNYVKFSQLQVFVDSVSSASLSQLYSDPTAIEASKAWSDCMRLAGFEYRTPFDVTNQDWESPRPGILEQETARADQRCRAMTAVEQQLALLDATRQEELLSGSLDVLAELAAIYDVVIEQATR
ncbi:MAG: hypothetical protein RLZZ623_463 [Actinomycetota bacterium]